MNTVMENLLTRRSVRAFEHKPLPASQLEEILKAAVYAPSAMGRQSWQFTAVTNRAKIKQLTDLMGKALGRPDYDMYSPETIVITSNAKDCRFGVDDNACAMENMFLAAHSFGIGSVWINQLRDVCDVPEIRSLLHQWGIPDDHVVLGVAALGYPASPSKKEVVKTGTIVYQK